MHRSCRGLSGGLAMVLFGGGCAGAAELHSVAATGMLAPDGGQFVSVDRSSYDVNARGEVAFIASTDRSGRGLWKLGVDGMQLVASSGMAAPQLSLGTKLYNVDKPSINAHGSIGFLATLEGPHNGRSAWLADGSGLLPLAWAGAAAPGDAVFTPDLNSVLVNASGQVLIHQGVGDIEDPHIHGLWSGQPQALELVAYSDRPAPGRSSTFYVLDRGSLSDTGEIAFYGLESGSDPYTQGLWAGRPGDIQLVAAEGITAPGTGGRAFKSGGLQPVLLAPNGYMAFKCSIDDPVANSGIWYRPPNGELQMLVRKGMEAPGLLGKQFDGFGTVRVNSAGQFAFTGHTFSKFSTGIWAGSAGQLRLLVQEGEPVPGAATGITFGGSPTSLGIDEVGNVLFAIAVFRPGSMGVGFGLWLATPQGDLTTLILEGETVSVDGQLRTVADIGWWSSESWAGGDPVVFVAFEDGLSGLFRVQAVPEPASIGLLAAMSLSLICRRRR